MPLKLLFLMCHCLLGVNLMAFGAKKKETCIRLYERVLLST